ncbi:mechanosensitive ion channel family protein [Candidatus Woesearchaeota archaeon]|nr:mechanosensitive ion channel family protein [Candidatus Woesearchaeota archaeon]
MIEQIADMIKLEIGVLSQYKILGNLLINWADALIVFGVSLFILKIFKFVIIKKLEALSKKTENEFDDMVIAMLNSIKWPFFILMSIYLGMRFLELHPILSKTADFIIMLIIVFYSIRAVQRFIDYGSKVYAKKNEEQDTTMMHFLSNVAKVLMWVIAGLIIISNLGYDISTLVAGLGIGGIAIALALQSVLGDLFASISIYFDKPFKVGDFIVLGTEMGEVKRIGIKSTRIQSLSGEEIVVSNLELTTARVRNYKKMKRRRIQYLFGVTYQTSNKKLKKILEIVKQIFKDVKEADLDRVHFKTFAASSLDFEVIFYVNTNDYTKYMDIQQNINFRLKEAFEKEKIDFAYPTQTVYLEK